MRTLTIAIAFLSLSITIEPPTIHAQDAQREVDATDRVLVVGTKEVAPFAMKRPDGSWGGVSIELWKATAEDLGLKYKFHETDLEGLLDGLEDGSLDAAVAALTVTPERERQIDFTHPFFTSGVGIAVAPKARSGWLGVLSGLFTRDFVKILISLLGLLLAIGLLVWAFERRRNPDQFGGRGAKGVWSGLWWSAVTMTTVGYGDKAPVTLPGRLLAILWMFSSLVMVSFFTATVTTMLTVSHLTSTVRGPNDLPSARVATVDESTSAEYLKAHRIRAGPCPVRSRPSTFWPRMTSMPSYTTDRCSAI